MDAATETPGGQEAVRTWLQQRRGAQLPPPAPADLRHLFNQAGKAGQPAARDGSSTEALAAAALAIARDDGLAAVTMVRLAAQLRASKTATYWQARSVAATQLLAATVYECHYHAQVVWCAHEDPPGMARLRRMFENAARWIAADGAFSPFADPAATTYHRLPDKVVAALELGRSRWRCALLGELRAAQAGGQLAPDHDSHAMFNALSALLHDIRRDRHETDAEARAERACAGMEGLLARHQPALVRTASRSSHTPRPAMPFHWPAWLMAGAPYGGVASP